MPLHHSRYDAEIKGLIPPQLHHEVVSRLNFCFNDLLNEMYSIILLDLKRKDASDNFSAWFCSQSKNRERSTAIFFSF